MQSRAKRCVPLLLLLTLRVRARARLRARTGADVMLRPGLWRSSDGQSRDDAQEQKRVLDLRKTTPTTRHERKTDQEELELARDEHALKGLAELRKQLRPSPNDLSVLFAPHLAHACTLVPNKPLRPLPFSHAKPWNENVQLESHRDEPSMQFGRPQKTSASKRARRVLPKRASSDQVSASWTSPAKTAVKRQRKTNATENETSKHQQPAIPSAMETLADLHEQEAARLILLREGLLAQAQARLRGVRPISHETFADQETLGRELARVSLLVVEVILRSRRVGCKAIDGANRDCREIGYEWNGANYLLKMISDVGMLDQLNITKASKFARNPLLLSHNLDELAKLIKVNVLEFETTSIWRFLDCPSTYEVRQYTAAIWILREEAHYERRQAPRMLEAMKNRVLPPDPAIVEAACLQEAANKEMAVGGCWKYGGKPISSAAAVASPHARARSKVTFEKRIRILENVYKENCEAQVQKREIAATQMQKIVRARLARRSIVQEENRRFVAVELQRFWRGGLARVDFAKRREQQADAMEIAPVMKTLNRQENAALRIQCLWRRAVATGRVQTIREDTAATQVIAWLRCHTQRWRHKAFIAARRIQMMARARFARDELARLRLEQKQNRAATKIQCIIRMRQAREVREGLVRDRAASRIQQRARIFVAYSLARKAVRAQIIIMSWRQHRARRLVRERRQFLRAVDLVQSWHRERSAARKAQLERKLASWRAKHTSVSRKFTSDTSNTKSWFHGCALYDHQRALQKQLVVLERTSTARRALERLEARIAKYAARLDELNVTVSFAPMRAMLKVKARYEQMLVITKHLSARELADAIDDATEELDAVEDRIEFIENLVRTAIKARDDFVIATRVTDAQEYVLCRSPTEFEAFNKAYLAAQRREQTLAEMQRKAEVAEARWRQMIIETEWKHRVRVETLEKASSETVSQLHKRSARAGAAQIALHIRTKGLAAAAERRAEVKRSVRIAEQLAGRISAMAEEDAYAEAHRAYLAASPLAMRAARKHFDAFDTEESLHPGEITPEDFQKLAFDLGVVVPMARIRDFVDRVDLNGNNLIDWDEFARWYFCCSEADKLRFQFRRMGTRAGASQLFQAGGLSTKLRVDQASRKAKRLVRATTSQSLLLTSRKSSRKTSRKLLPK